MEPNELTPIPKQEITLDANVGMDEVAAIRVAQIERDLMNSEQALRTELATLRKQIEKDTADRQKAVVKDIKENNPELDAIEGALKKLFGKEFTIYIQSAGEGVQVNVEISARGTVTAKGSEVKELSKSIEAAQKKVTKAEDDLVKVKRGLGQLSHVERQAKAAVAQIKLEGTAHGKKVLERLSSITIPGLPAPKK